jgi:hypothetical protein
MQNQSINCGVTQCRFHDQANNCTLKDINVSSSANQPSQKQETQCASFETM